MASNINTCAGCRENFFPEDYTVHHGVAQLSCSHKTHMCCIKTLYFVRSRDNLPLQCPICELNVTYSRVTQNPVAVSVAVSPERAIVGRHAQPQPTPVVASWPQNVSALPSSNERGGVGRSSGNPNPSFNFWS